MAVDLSNVCGGRLGVFPHDNLTIGIGCAVVKICAYSSEFNVNGGRTRTGAEPSLTIVASSSSQLILSCPFFSAITLHSTLVHLEDRSDPVHICFLMDANGRIKTSLYSSVASCHFHHHRGLSTRPLADDPTFEPTGYLDHTLRVTLKLHPEGTGYLVLGFSPIFRQ